MFHLFYLINYSKLNQLFTVAIFLYKIASFGNFVVIVSIYKNCTEIQQHNVFIVKKFINKHVFELFFKYFSIRLFSVRLLKYKMFSNKFRKLRKF